MKRVLCRTDASIKIYGDKSLIGLGGAVFNEDRTMRASFALQPPGFLADHIHKNIDFAEALAIYEMVNFCAINGQKNLKIITDNLGISNILSGSGQAYYATSYLISKIFKTIRLNGMVVEFGWEPRKNNVLSDKLAEVAHQTSPMTFCPINELLDIAVAKSVLQRLIKENGINIYRVKNGDSFNEPFVDGVFLLRKTFFCSNEHSSRALLLSVLGYLATAPIYRKRLNIDLIENTKIDDDTYILDVAMAVAEKLFSTEDELRNFVCLPAGFAREDYEESIRCGNRHLHRFGQIEIDETNKQSNALESGIKFV